MKQKHVRLTSDGEFAESVTVERKPTKNEQDMIRCTRCSVMNSVQARVCERCGQPIHDIPFPSSQSLSVGYSAAPNKQHAKTRSRRFWQCYAIVLILWFGFTCVVVLEIMANKLGPSGVLINIGIIGLVGKMLLYIPNQIASQRRK